MKEIQTGNGGCKAESLMPPPWILLKGDLRIPTSLRSSCGQRLRYNLIQLSDSLRRQITHEVTPTLRDAVKRTHKLISRQQSRVLVAQHDALRSLPVSSDHSVPVPTLRSAPTHTLLHTLCKPIKCTIISMRFPALSYRHLTHQNAPRVTLPHRTSFMALKLWKLAFQTGAKLSRHFLPS